LEKKNPPGARVRKPAIETRAMRIMATVEGITWLWYLPVLRLRKEIESREMQGEIISRSFPLMEPLNQQVPLQIGMLHKALGTPSITREPLWKVEMRMATTLTTEDSALLLLRYEVVMKTVFPLRNSSLYRRRSLYRRLRKTK
jgi:hypothetical protein